MNSQNTVLRVLKGFVRWVDRFRRIVHLLVLLLVLSLLATVVSQPGPIVPESAALVLSVDGVLVDQLSGDPLQRAIALAQGFETGETLLSDLVEALRQAEGDDRIKALVLNTDGLISSGLSKLQELGQAISRFSESGKPVYAIGANFDRDQYFLAAHADEILVHPMGMVLIDGYSTYIPYYKSALDKLYIDYNAWTVGEFKSFVEPFTRDGMSDADRESRSVYLSAMWDIYQRDVETVRGLDQNSLQRYADEFIPLLRESDGDSAQLAVDYGLVDEAIGFDEFRSRLREIVGPNRPGGDSYAAIGHRDYLTALDAYNLPEITSSKVGLIVASGTILDGVQPPGTVGGESLARLIRRANTDQAIKALVLRIDSPGGSAYASEVILQELEVFRASGRPLVVSMGSVAASGGYWIAMNADEIWASPSTLTGSIGVGATFPTVQRALSQLGINVDGLGTTELSGQMDPLQGVGDDIREFIQISIERTYDDFIGKVAEHRERQPEEVDAVAQGRVWVGSDAAERGLVDHLGGLKEAIESAANLAGLEPNSYSIDEIDPELSLAERIARDLLSASAPVISSLGFDPGLPESIERIVEVASEPLAFLDQLNDPRGIYAYCFCDVR